MARQPNWEKHGNETAKGKRGTGWMSFNDYDAKKLSEEYPIEKYPDGIPVEAIDKHAHGWLETLQFEYEVGNNMTEWAMREAEKEGEKENWIYIFGEKESEWEYGYVNYMTKLLAKNKIKIED